MNGEVMGDIKSSAFSNILPQIRLQGMTRLEVAHLMRVGRLSFLFDDDGQFITDGRLPRG
jgi:hypothetical protein